MSNVAALRPSLTLPDLAEQLMAAKVAEKNAEASRIAAEQALIAALGFDKTEGQETQTIGDLKVTVKASLKRSIDWAKYDAIEASIPEALRPVKVVTERKLDEAGVKYLIAEQPAVYRTIAKALTVTPAKTSITIVRTV